MNTKYFEIARKIAITLSTKRPNGKKNKARLVAVLIPQTGSELFIGINDMDSFHPASPHPHKTRHAEFDAVLKAKDKTEGSDIYVYRETAFGQALARPCKYCFNMLIEKGIKNIFYSDQDGFYSYTKGKIHD